MTNFFVKPLAAAALITGLVSPAMAEQSRHSFTRDGFSYSYQVEQKGDAIRIVGTSQPGFGRYDLTVRNGKVTGTQNGRAIAFLVADVETGRPAAEQVTMR